MPEHLDRLADNLASNTSRRGFLARVSGAMLAAAGAGTVVRAVVPPGEAGAFHLCGHTFTTGSCPHPAGMPRIDSRGYPIRARDGVPVLQRACVISHLPVDLLGERRAGEPGADRGGQSRAAGAVLEVLGGSVGEHDLHAA